ncbi:MAG: hypothetical protein IJ661_00070 [Lachnospiraceae bacterium]|nr:hypothetical protein [Lachnospiraceae bacterium]
MAVFNIPASDGQKAVRYSTKQMGEGGNIRVRFPDSAEVHRVIENGSIEVDGGVTLTLSEEAIEKLKETAKNADKQTEQNAKAHWAEFNGAVGDQQAKGMEMQADAEAKMLEIARRISKGGIVPAKDEQALAEYNIDMYQMAKQMGFMAKEHEKYKKSLMEENEEMAEGVKEAGERVDEIAGEGYTAQRVEMEISTGGGEPAVVDISTAEVTVGVIPR